MDLNTKKKDENAILVHFNGKFIRYIQNNFSHFLSS